MQSSTLCLWERRHCIVGGSRAPARTGATEVWRLLRRRNRFNEVFRHLNDSARPNRHPRRQAACRSLASPTRHPVVRRSCLHLSPAICGFSSDTILLLPTPRVLIIHRDTLGGANASGYLLFRLQPICFYSIRACTHLPSRTRRSVIEARFLNCRDGRRRRLWLGLTSIFGLSRTTDNSTALHSLLW